MWLTKIHSQYFYIQYFFKPHNILCSPTLNCTSLYWVKSIKFDQFHHLSCDVSSKASRRTETNKLQRWGLYGEILIEHEG